MLSGCQVFDGDLDFPFSFTEGLRYGWDRRLAGPGDSWRGGALVTPSDQHVYKATPPQKSEVQSVKYDVEANPETLLHTAHSELPEEVIDLQTALARAGVDNPTIASALEAVRASQARQLQAEAMLLPTLHGGASFDWHQGKLQTGQGAIIDVERQSAYVGAGAYAVGAGTVAVPGILLSAHLGDALFEPQAASSQLAARQLDSQATRNAVLLSVANSFFALADAEARLKAMQQSEADFAEIAKMTASFAKAKQGSPADAQRAETDLLLHHAAAQGIEEEAGVASAELTRLLNVDPNIRLRSPPDNLPLLQLVDPRDVLERLIQIALANRPEIAARSAEVAVTETELRKEKVRPLLPVLAVGFSAGGFGGGGSQADTSFGHWSSRTDFDVIAYWTLQNFGLGNLAQQRDRRAKVGEAIAERARLIDSVRQEVAEAYTLSATRQQQMEVALLRMQTAQRAFQQDLTRARNLQGRPIEVLDSAKQLSTARQDYLRALTGFNRAQIQLFVSLGNPP
jgi:outer membrane protein TolC